MEVEAVDEGKIEKLMVAEGTEGVAVNSVIALIEGEGEEDDPSCLLRKLRPADPPSKRLKTNLRQVQKFPECAQVLLQQGCDG